MPSALAGKLDAGEWLQQSVIKTCGGKGGGKADRAQGSGDGADKIELALAEAVKFADAKLN